jgi:hypothetical protein
MARNSMLSVVLPALLTAPIYPGTQSVVNGGAHASGPFSRAKRVIELSNESKTDKLPPGRIDRDYAAARALAGERELCGCPMRGESCWT